MITNQDYENMPRILRFVLNFCAAVIAFTLLGAVMIACYMVWHIIFEHVRSL